MTDMAVTDKYFTIQEAIDLSNATCKKCARNKGFEKANDLINRIEFKFSDALKVTIGNALYLGITKPVFGIVKFSNRLWQRASEQERRETIVHEACHIIADHIFKVQPDGLHHGKEWKQVMALAGYPNASRCHTVDTSGQPNHVRAICSCQVYDLTPQRAEIVNTLECPSCKGGLLIVSSTLRTLRTKRQLIAKSIK